MQIDWITVIAQVVNFLVLVWLLQRFLYRPVLAAMDRREQRIADQLEDARRRERDAQEEGERYQQEREALERRRDELLAEQRESAQREKQELLELAKEDAARARERWQHQTEQEKDAFLEALRLGIADLVPDVARRALAGLADADLESRILHHFLSRLESLDSETRDALAASDGPLSVTSSFEIASADRRKLTHALHEQIAADAEVEYAVSDELLCGIEIAAGGRRVRWSLSEYLDQWTRSIEDIWPPVGK
ncbi:MAG: F0F1 ATP synthase subunit B [Planctomycetota bacterium]